MARETVSKNELEALIGELESKMGRLRTLYEQYFMGIERTPPTEVRKDVFRLVSRLDQMHVQNTAQKFHVRSLIQRFNSYKAYWSRTERQIENGTYHRDRNRAARNKSRREAREAVSDAPPVIELEMEELEDLGAFQKELEAMDANGAFDAYNRPQAPQPKAQPTEEEKKAIKEARLKEIRAKLMADAGAPAAPAAAPVEAAPQAAPAVSSRQAKLDKLRRKVTEKPAAAASGATPSAAPTGGASMERLRELYAQKKRLQSNRPQQGQAQGSPQKTAQNPRPASTQRVIQRGGGAQTDQAQQVYQKLVAAKKRCNEPTSGLTYDSVKKSMTQQREHLKKTRGAKDVDFKVVIKDGKAFLKPVTK